MAALILLHAGIAIIAPTLRLLGRRVFLVCGVAPLVTFVWAVVEAPRVIGGTVLEHNIEWVPSLGLDFDFRLDAMALLMVLLVSGIGTLVFVYAYSYFGTRHDLGRVAAWLTAFAGSMLGLVLSDNLLALFVFWELTSITSYMLVGTDDDKPAARAAALQALLITAGGGLAMLAGFVLLGFSAGTFTMSEILAAPPAADGVVVAALVLVLTGAFTKSAQFPFHSWLPGAMQAPTPVSAYLHSATMVKAGVYLIARFAPAFADVGIWRPLVVGVGLTTMLYGAYRALYQRDLKLLLAYGTISQLGFMITLFGAGTEATIRAGTAVLFAHALFKAALFMVVGIIDHQAHTRDLRLLSGLWRRLPAGFFAAVLAGASMAAVPPLLGFISKEVAYDSLLGVDFGWSGIVFAGVFVASILTFGYSARFLWGGFWQKTTDDFPGSDITEDRFVGAEVPRAKARFAAPAVLLALASLVLGLYVTPVSELVAAAASALDPAIKPKELHLWPGMNTALVFSLITIAAGIVLFGARRVVARLQARRLPDVSNAIYRGALHGIVVGSNRITRVTQSGSLPTYLLVILWTMLLVPGIAAIAALSRPDNVRFATSPYQIVIGILVISAGITTVFARRRFAAVMFVGAMGYGVAILFVIQGAPDLALTQFLVDTVAIVAYVLVLRHLPSHFEPAPFRRDRAARLVTSVFVGIFVLVFALAIGAPNPEPVGRYYVENALPEADGRNVVNTLLVDFRAFDTLGEITVVMIAALGVASLLVAGRKYLAEDNRPESELGHDTEPESGDGVEAA